MARLLTASFLTLLGIAGASSAQALLDYQNRVIHAAEQVERMKADADYGDEGVASIKKLLPKTERVQIEGRDLSVDNTWLYDLLDAYGAEPDAVRRLELIDEAAGSLRSLGEHLGRLQSRPPDNVDGNSSREKVREILERAEYAKKVDNPFAAFIKRARNEIIAFVSKIMDRIFGAVFGSSAASNLIFTVFLLVMAAIVLSALIRTTKRIELGRKRVKKRTVLGEEVEAAATAGGLAEAALAAARDGDFRSAVRKLYISLLYDLADRNLIELHANATNRDYLSRVSRYAALAEPMRFLTEKFDHTWYGMFASSSEDFSAFHARYSEALRQAQNAGERAGSGAALK